MSAPSGNGDPPPRPRASLFRRAAKPSPPPPVEPTPGVKLKKPRRSMLAALSAFLSFVLIGAIIAVGAVAWLMIEGRKPGPLAEDKTVNIVREEDGGTIAEQLERAGVVDSATWFTLLSVLDGNRSSLKRGEYEFKAGVSMNDVETLLAQHKVVRHKITIPEGLTSDQIVQRLREDDVLVGDVKEIPREGSLMPNTYLFERGDTRASIVGQMSKAQTRIVEDIWKNRAQDLPIKSPGEMVTLASIVEKETGKADERPKVAGVFVNRLTKHMRLESDPTIVYGLAFGKGTLGRPITRADLNQPTAYNTYLIDGLPPGPISNPGKAALEAVANPVRGKDLYFVADGTGGHVFADTFEQHLKNVAHWRQIEKDEKDHLAPDVTPPQPATHGAIAPPDPQSFGALVPVTPVAPAAAALAGRLGKLGTSRHAVDAALSSIAGGAGGARSIEDLGGVVSGVNDAPAEGEAFADATPSIDGSGSPSSVPLSPAMLADERAREAKYGLRPAVDGTDAAPVQQADGAAAGQTQGTATAAPPTASGRPRIYDASEGTKLDPLLNKTYDLSFAKVVPTAMGQGQQ